MANRSLTADRSTNGCLGGREQLLETDGGFLHAEFHVQSRQVTQPEIGPPEWVVRINGVELHGEVGVLIHASPQAHLRLPEEEGADLALGFGKVRPHL